VLYSMQFQVSEAWIAFNLNETLIYTEADGDFNLFALMDAASGYLMSTTTVPARWGEPSQLEFTPARTKPPAQHRAA
jgi:hypothetical protein